MTDIKPIVICIAGGTGSGKTTVVKKIVQMLPAGEVAVIPQDAYYRDQSHLSIGERRKVNYDHPQSVEFELLIAHIESLKAGLTVEMPQYSYLTCSRSDVAVAVEPRHVIIVEGILTLTNKPLRSICEIKIFVDAMPDDRLVRVITRDIEERGRTAEDVLKRYMDTVKPSHDQFIEPSKRFADLIIPQGGSNLVAIDVLASMIKSKLKPH